MKCYKCKVFGHVASHCKKRNYCVYCKKSSHIVTKFQDLQQKGNNWKKNNHQAYQAITANVSLIESNSNVKLDVAFLNELDVASLNATNNVGSTGGHAIPIFDEIQQLVQNSMSLTISFAFSVIGLSSKNFHKINSL